MLPDIAERATSTEIVRRSFQIDDFEFRDSDDGDGFTFEGVASVVDTPYQVRDRWGSFTETIRSGAFNKTLKDSKADVALFVNHQHQSIPLATRAAGTLKLTADPNLRVTASLDRERPSVLDVRSAVTRGEMRQMSIGFTVPKARDKWNDDMSEREIAEVALVETSIVWRGANPHTTGVMRSIEELFDFELDEDELRRAITHFTSLLPPDERQAAEETNPFAERDREDRERLERKRLLRA
jgi:HK97 family phage prohead protease